MTFTTTPLLGGGTLVEGTDSTGKDGRTILISERWEAVKHARAHQAAGEAFDAVVKEFFAPLTDAADEAKALLAGPDKHWNRVVLTEGSEGVSAEVIDLDLDGVLLRMLAEGQHNQLRWIGDDTLVATV